ERITLRNQDQALAGDPMGRQSTDRVSAELDPAPHPVDEADDRPQERGLPVAVESHQAKPRSRGNRQIDIVDDLHRPVTSREIGKLEDRGHDGLGGIAKYARCTAGSANASAAEPSTMTFPWSISISRSLMAETSSSR